MNSTLKFLGRDSAFSKSNTSAYYIDRKHLILIDCGTNILPTIIDKFNFNLFNNISILITHLHPDHAGGLAHLIMYLGYIFNFNSNNLHIVSKCKNLELMLNIMGVEKKLYSICSSNFAIPIYTEHVPQLDSYGFLLHINNKKIIYTGDTSSLDSFIPFLPCDEMYIDVSKGSSSFHLSIDNIITFVETTISLNYCKIFLMHIDDIIYISEAIKEIANISVVNI